MGIVNAFLLIVIVLIIYFILIQIFATLLRMTGLTKQKALFQTISMITGVGFTTGESEIISGDRYRRRIALACMISGTVLNVLIISLLINLINSFNVEEIKDTYITVSIIAVATIFFFIFMRLPFMVRFSTIIIEAIAKKLFRMNSSKNVLTQIDNYEKYAIYQISINIVPDFLYDKTLAEANLKATYGINIMMIKRHGRMIDINKDTIIQEKDMIYVFGLKSTIKDCFDINNESMVKKVTGHEKAKVNEIALIDNFGQDAMVEITLHDIPQSLQNTKLVDSNLRNKYYISVLKLKRHHATIVVDKDTILEVGDTVLLLGPYKNVKMLFGATNQNSK